MFTGLMREFRTASDERVKAWERPEEVGHKKSNLGAGQRKLAGSFVMTHRS